MCTGVFVPIVTSCHHIAPHITLADLTRPDLLASRRCSEKDSRSTLLQGKTQEQAMEEYIMKVEALKEQYA